MSARFQIRLATAEDIPTLRELIRASVRGLQAEDYSAEQLECALEAAPERLIGGCGGWSKRKTLYGGDVWRGREDSLLDPKTQPAKIRAFFVHPEWARNGI